jgi:hypothetical protein
MTIVEEFEAKFLNKTVTPEDKKEIQEVPAVAIGVVALISDLLPEPGSTIGHGAHLGGHLFGACFFLAPHLSKLICNCFRRKDRFSFSWMGVRRTLTGMLDKVGAFAGEVVSELRIYLSSRMEQFCNQMAARSALESSSSNPAIIDSGPRPWDLQDYDDRILSPLDDFDAQRDWTMSMGGRPMGIVDNLEAEMNRCVRALEESELKY